MKKSLVFIIACLLWGSVAYAQPQKLIEKDFEKFSTVKVEDKFDVKMYTSDRYSVRINVDERIAAHVQAYEKNGTLYLILDEKGYTKELKKQLKQRLRFLLMMLFSQRLKTKRKPLRKEPKQMRMMRKKTLRLSRLSTTSKNRKRMKNNGRNYQW